MALCSVCRLDSLSPHRVLGELHRSQQSVAATDVNGGPIRAQAERIQATSADVHLGYQLGILVEAVPLLNDTVVAGRVQQILSRSQDAVDDHVVGFLFGPQYGEVFLAVVLDADNSEAVACHDRHVAVGCVGV
uniref:(northern house mosquito) hypothetical protein n=1 Tax=Culex pipiens TaxID=7175 RepID=A0A8D8APU2_CULPI